MRHSRLAFGYVGFCVLFCLGLASQPSIPQEPFSKLVGDVKVGNVEKTDVLEVPFIFWGGDVATFLANGGTETKDGTIFQKAGLKLKLKKGDDFPAQVKDYLAGKTPFLRGTFSMLGLASEVLGKDPRTQPVVFLQMTWSAGDHVVSRAEIKTLSDLKGKKIALQEGGPHVGMLDDVLNMAKLKWSDVKVVWTKDVTGDKGPAASFRKDKDIDACFVITPDMSSLTDPKGGVKGARLLVSTQALKRSIADVYACRKDYYDANRAQIEKFAAAYLKGCEELVALKKQVTKDKLPAKYKEILKMTQEIYGKEAIPTEDDADGLISDAVFVGLPGNKSFFKDKGNLSGFEAKQKAALDLAVGQGYAKNRFPFLTADFDYANLKKLGGLKADPDQSASGVSELATIPKGEVLSDNTIYYFTISFEASSSEFPEAIYGNDFQAALERGSLAGNALIAVRGHADTAKLLQDFVRAGLETKAISRLGKPGEYQYFLKDGTKLDLTDTKKVTDLIRNKDFSFKTIDPRGTLLALEKLSKDRSEAARDAIIRYAEKRNIRFDKNQIKFEGVGVNEPIVAVPKNDEQAAANRRVEIRFISLRPEDIRPEDFDF